MLKKTEKKIEWIKKNPSLSQIYGSGLEYAFCSEDDKQSCPFVFCKDFLQDAIYGTVNNKKAAIYGFSYDPKVNPPLHFENTKILIANSNDHSFGSKIEACGEFINQIEKILKLKRTGIFKCIEPPAKYQKCGVYLLKSSGRWMTSPPMISIYTLFVRLGFCHTLGNSYDKTINGVIAGTIPQYQSNDRSYLQSSINGIKKLLNHGYKKLFSTNLKKNFVDVGVSSMHNNCGIVSYTNGYTKLSFPHWHKLDGGESKLCLPSVPTQSL